MIEVLSGGLTRKFLQEKNLYCLIVEKEETIIEAVWSSDGNATFKSKPCEQIFDIRGKTIETKNSPNIEITGEVIFIKKQKNNYKEIDLKLINE